MPPSTNDDGTTPFEVRPGIGGMPAFGGMFRRGDPSRIPSNRFHTLLNTRLASDGEIVSRPGLRATAGYEEEACITGIVELEQEATGSSTEHGIFIQGVTSPRDSNGWYFGTGEPPFMLSHLGPDGVLTPCWPRPQAGSGVAASQTSPVPLNAKWGHFYQSAWYTAGRGFVWPTRTVVSWRGKTVVVGFEAPAEEGAQQPILPYGDPRDLYLYEFAFRRERGQGQVDITRLVAIPRTVYGNVADLCVRTERIGGEALEILYIGTENGQVLRWDGVTLSVEHDFGVANPVRLCVLSTGHLCAAGSDALGHQLPGGAWTDIAFKDQNGDLSPGVAVTGMVEWRGRLLLTAAGGVQRYWTPGAAEVLVWMLTVSGGGTEPVTFGGGSGWPYAPVVVGGDLFVLICPMLFGNFGHGPFANDITPHVAKVTSWTQNISGGPPPQYDNRVDPLLGGTTAMQYVGFLVPHAGGLLTWRAVENGNPQSEWREELISFDPVTGVETVLWSAPPATMWSAYPSALDAGPALVWTA